MAWIDVAAAEAVAEDEVFAVDAQGLPVALFRVQGQVYALHDLCSHGFARLSDGYVEDDCVECPLHQGLVDIRTGAPRAAPISTPIRSIPARQSNGRIELDI